MKLLLGNCLDTLKDFPDNSVHSIVTDPPYGFSFMGKKWDYDVPSVEIWKECLRVLKPGGHLLAFSGTRTQHRMAVRIEDAGFEIRDMIAWIYGSGFPKSHNIGKAVDKIQGNKREYLGIDKTKYRKDNDNNNVYAKHCGQTGEITKGNSEYEGWGTALKPALEPITMARKPISEKNIAENCLKHKTGGINIDGCRVGNVIQDTSKNRRKASSHKKTIFKSGLKNDGKGKTTIGRFPANLIHDGSDEVEELFPEQSSRFFYCAKTSKKERNEGLDGFEEKQPKSQESVSLPKDENGNYLVGGDRGASGKYQVVKSPSKNHHPTVKPVALMSYLVRLVTPKDGIVLDPFMGSGSTGIACVKEGFDFIGCELDEEYMEIAKARIGYAENKKKEEPQGLF